MDWITAVLVINLALVSDFPEHEDKFAAYQGFQYEVATGFEAWDWMGITVSTDKDFVWTSDEPPFPVNTWYACDVYLDHWGFKAGMRFTYRSEYNAKIWDSEFYNNVAYIGFDSRLADWW